MEQPNNSIEIADGKLKVTIDLTQPNAEIISLGMLEKAKSASQVWIFNRKKIAEGAIRAASQADLHILGGKKNGI